MGRLHRGTLLAGGLLLAGAALGTAHVRLHHSGNGNELFWSSPGSVGIVINSAGSDNIADGSHETAIRSAIQTWNRVGGTTVQLIEDTSAVQQARTDWENSGLHLVLFDEDNSSGYFPPGSGTVAITPLWFFSSGQISDADILFNGSDHDFTTEGAPGDFDVEDVVTHEMGHLLGLDHSGWAGATMYPFVDETIILQRSLSSDDENGMRDAYPSGSAATVTGTIERSSDSSPVAGAHVVARSANGRTAGATITDDDGGFALRGLGAGTYTVYANPLDDPVNDTHLTAGHTIETDFEAGVYGSTATVGAGGSFDLGTLQVDADVALNLGRIVDPFPSRAVQGATRSLSIHGTGLVAGSTLSASDPTVSVSSVAWLTTRVDFDLTVPPAAPSGHVDLTVTDPSGDLSILSAAIEVTPPDPAVTSVAPAVGSMGGGTALTITGTGFNPDLRVVIGDRIYQDGEPGGCTVVDSTTVQLTTAATIAGTHDVVVVDESGVEGRLDSGFTSVSTPSIATVFPAAGAAAGGTEIVLSGSDFLPGLIVRIDGVVQTNLSYEELDRVRITSSTGGLPGGPYVLEVENPDGGFAASVFSYAAGADPSVMAVAPTTGSTAGGEEITLTGTGFTADTEVWFGVDPDTGLGGVAATDVVLEDSGTLTVTTPAHGGGSVSVMAMLASTGQVGLQNAAFSYGGGGGGGGGCYTRMVDGAVPPTGGRNALLGSAWFLLLLGATLWRSARSRRVLAHPVRR